MQLTQGKSGKVQVILFYFDKCESTWGGSPATRKIRNGIDTCDVNVYVENTKEEIHEEDEENSHDENEQNVIDISGVEEQSHVTVETSQEQKAEVETTKEPFWIKNKTREYQIKISYDNGMLQFAKEDIEFKKEFLKQQNDMNKEFKPTISELSGTVSKLSKSIADAFGMLGGFLTNMQQNSVVSQWHPSTMQNMPLHNQ